MPQVGQFNSADIAVVVILVVCVLGGWQKGLIKSVFGLFSVVIALVLSKNLYPAVSKFLRGMDGFYGFLKQAVIDNLGISEAIKEQTLSAQQSLIESLNVPGVLTGLLLSNNNAELYRLFDVSVVEQYIASYIANLILNALAMALVFALVIMIMAALSGSLRLISKLPVISAFNRVGGIACGFACGALVVWFGIVALAFLYAYPAPRELMTMVEQSTTVARFFYDNNILMDMIAKIST